MYKTHKSALKLIELLLVGFIFISTSGCVTYLGIDGPYIGKVIDADTKMPIEGVVAHGSWEKLNFSHPAPFYRSVEVLTDKNGEFRIPGVGLLFLSSLSMGVTIFKAGYDDQSWPAWNYTKQALLEGSKMNSQWIELKGDVIVFKLKESTAESRLHHSYGFVESNEPKDAHKLLDMEIAKDKEMFKKIDAEYIKTKTQGFKHP